MHRPVRRAFILITFSFPCFGAEINHTFPCYTDLDCTVVYDNRCHVPVGVLKAHAKALSEAIKAIDAKFIGKSNPRTCEMAYEGEAYCGAFHECHVRAPHTKP